VSLEDVRFLLPVDPSPGQSIADPLCLECQASYPLARIYRPENPDWGELL
jgi:hypothetical protein